MKELRTAERIRVAMEVLADRAPDGGYVSINELWDAALARVPLTPHEAELNTKGITRGHTNWRFASSGFIAPGWLRRNQSLAGEWAITKQGVAALDENPGDELLAEAQPISSVERLRLRDETA